jgi:hypothetical protein
MYKIGAAGHPCLAERDIGSVFHGYNIDTDDIWKKIINKMKSCTQVWKTRNLTFKGKTLIVKNFLLAQMGFEIEMRGIPEIC